MRVGDCVLAVGVSPDPADVYQEYALFVEQASLEALVLVAYISAEVTHAAVLRVVDDALEHSVADLDDGRDQIAVHLRHDVRNELHRDLNTISVVLSEFWNWRCR